MGAMGVIKRAFSFLRTAQSSAGAKPGNPVFCRFFCSKQICVCNDTWRQYNRALNVVNGSLLEAGDRVLFRVSRAF
jgi:hypothetical protein